MIDKTVNLDLLFETSWEVCNKIGGIYTVLSTKAKTLQNLYKDKTIFLGPDVWTQENPSPYFTQSKTLLKDWQKNLQLPYGITVRVGRWDVPGKPIVVLVGFGGLYAVKDEFYSRMWQLYGVDSLHAYGDYDEACAFSHAAGIVIESLCSYYGTDNKNIIAHFDEWTTGMGLLYVNDRLPQVATVFTTHATCIGRSICGNHKPLYDYLAGYDGDQMARELNMESKHSLEKAAAHTADCFTTVSDVTAKECEQLLQRRPLVTPNGFEQNFVPAKSRFNKDRAQARSRMLQVASTLTGNNYDDNTFIIITSGRCEYTNKGIDMFLESVARVRDYDPQRKLLAFVMVPAWVKDKRSDLANELASGTINRLSDPVITHNLNNADSDPVLSRIHQIGFQNSKSDNVNVIYVPSYLNGNDGIFNMDYYSVLIGADATAFPSYYEPWGYTPLESVAFGVPTITTSLSGFGQWVLGEGRNGLDNSGVQVVARGDFNYDEAATAIALYIVDLLKAPADEISKIRQAAHTTADMAAWSYFITYYIGAFATALENAAKRNK
ncbi:MAG: glycogen/starch synthase [Muribaculum sp.]|nr:glycogen/starch synthase [Muribaculaceae bacterium]MCM1080342.1 glycogen/starch synthase [Muribaculum sp.]